MSRSRAVIVLGMHRSGTSAVARGLAALGVHLGDSFLDTRPDNPTGYWEDKGVVDISERVLGTFGLRWEDVSLIDWPAHDEPKLRALRLEAAGYLKDSLASRPLWGFKDPRTVRLLPFWQTVFRELEVDESYVVAIRNPLSVALSLYARQRFDGVSAHRLWLVYIVPHLSGIAGKPFVVVDYDLLVCEPRAQLERLARELGLPLGTSESSGIDAFANGFLDRNLRHSTFSRLDFDARAGVSPLTREAYLWLYELATDQIQPGEARFWSAWNGIRRGVQKLIRAGDDGLQCS